MSFKLSVVAQIERGEMTYGGTAKRYCMRIKLRRSYHKTMNIHHRFRQHSNLLKAGENQVVLTGSELFWGADIRYIPTHEQIMYLSLITDAFSRKIVGYYVHESLHTEHVTKAVTEQQLVHHSDRKIQSCSHHYRNTHVVEAITC